MLLVNSKIIKKINLQKVIISQNNLIKSKVNCTYGDATSREVLDSLNVKNVKILISTIPRVDENIFILEYAKLINPKIHVIVTANHVGEAFQLYDFGADYVIVPHVLSGEKISMFLKDMLKSDKHMLKIRKQHIDYLEHLESFGLN